MRRSDTIKLYDFFIDESDRCERLIAALELCSLYRAGDMDLMSQDELAMVS